jgi:hypothetical protein
MTYYIMKNVVADEFLNKFMKYKLNGLELKLVLVLDKTQIYT